jgi:lipoprotein-anchoring transpeptidase ErfK/SrfK
MNNQFIEAREFIAKARAALRRGDRPAARQLGEQAALRAPQMEDAWLVLAASDPDAREALAYARKALQLNPQSARARRGVEWASGRLKQAQVHPEPSRRTKERTPVPQRIVPNQVGAVTGLPQKRAYQTAVALPQLTADRPNWLLPALLAGVGFMFVGLLVWFALTSPLLASFVRDNRAPAEKHLWAPVEIAKPTITPIGARAFAPADSPASPPVHDPAHLNPPPGLNAAPTDTPAALQTPTPADIPTEAPTATPAITETPGTLAMEIIEDTPTSLVPTYSAPKEQIASSGNGKRWIDVDLTNQRVYAYEGDVIVNSFIVSTGTWLTPTVTGKYKIYVKIRSGNMHGPGYFLPDVPYIMYFHKGYGLHGTYWHNNFGTPMSHGCVNLRTDEAGWLFNWASVGTVVNVHY